MRGSRLHFGHEPEPRCSICAREVTLELSKTDEQGQAVHEVCYVQATLADLRAETERTLLRDRATIPVLAIETRITTGLERSFWKPFAFVRW